MYHILYDGYVMDEQNYSVLGGQAEQIGEALKERYEADADLETALRLGAQVLASEDGESLTAEQLEVALLDRRRERRAFRRIAGEELSTLLGTQTASS
jgi:proteasome alpha subunit